MRIGQGRTPLAYSQNNKNSQTARQMLPGAETLISGIILKITYFSNDFIDTRILIHFFFERIMLQMVSRDQF